MPKNVRDVSKLIGAKGFKKMPKVQNIAQSGHTAHHTPQWKGDTYLDHAKCGESN